MTRMSIHLLLLGIPLAIMCAAFAVAWFSMESELEADDSCSTTQEDNS